MTYKVKFSQYIVWLLLYSLSMTSAVYAQQGSNSSTASVNRSITITNQCPFDVSLQSVGANAAAMACSPSATSAQANCPDNFVCYNKNANTSYCVAGTTTSTTFPITKTKEITLTASTCASGTQVTDATSPNWGQCSCTASNQCAAGQVCQTATKGLQQCYWGFSLPDNGLLSKTTGSISVPITPNTTSANALVASGKFYAKFGCDNNGNCLSDNTLGAPATLIEYTFQNNNDWYDVSYINGINLPATMAPVMSTNLDYSSSDPYRCMAAGGDNSTIAAIAAYQTKNNISGNTSLQPFACTNNYDKVFDKKLSGFNFVSAVSNAPTCSTKTPCAGGLVCGLTLAQVQQGGTTTTCGNRLGYWTYAQFCSANSSYNNTDLGIACGTTQNLAYALCKNQSSLTDQGPGRSCFNSTTTNKKDTCCGYESWAWNSNPQPLGVGDSPVKGVDTTYWKKNILPAIKPIKAGCPLAYSYQYDDPYSTFTCATKSSGFNAANYNITLCPGNASAGINPPTPPACTALVPTGMKPYQFTLGIPANISVKINGCSSGGSCKTSVKSPATAIYDATAIGNGQYQITATNKKGNKQVCTFNIPIKGCVTRVTGPQQCNTWTIAPDGAWQGRSIGIPNF